ncbi:hypothetical protein JX265_011327 [Neoarthrinium moseri]|uniref:Uncharacterized protein n=1 Tax=Neoarthrinium moseri TaxID=1658444 RepID=A0A9P9WCJ1_9PEZI|nr:hypothetical protein JX265_011327 [Neoarthrinium moseri]
MHNKDTILRVPEKGQICWAGFLVGEEAVLKDPGARRWTPYLVSPVLPCIAGHWRPNERLQANSDDMRQLTYYRRLAEPVSWGGSEDGNPDVYYRYAGIVNGRRCVRHEQLSSQLL